MTIDWTKPIEAVHEDGRVVRGIYMETRGWGREVWLPNKQSFIVDENGKSPGSPWILRNIAEPLRPWMSGHWVFRLASGGYVGTRKNNGRMYESRPTAADQMLDARVFNTKAAASRAGGALGEDGEALAVDIFLSGRLK